MSQLPMHHRGKQPRFFATEGIDEIMTMVLELTSEIYVIKKRQYVLEKVAGEQGINLSEGIESYELNEQEAKELETFRSELIARVLRSTEGQFAPTQRLTDGDAGAGQNAEAA